VDNVNLYFVRHGETEKNKSKCYYGSLDVDLTEKGILQAEKAGELLNNINFSKIYVSEKKRAVKTAKILLKDKQYELITDIRINERDFGEFEGKNYEEFKQLYPKELEVWCADWKNISPPKGESYIQLYERVKNFMNDILKLEEENILIVGHGGVIRSVYCYVLGGNMDYFWNFGSNNGDISIIKYEYGNLYIDSITHV
jgi:alpha-ribazole phosphatase